jgi:hypothetical protein
MTPDIRLSIPKTTGVGQAFVTTVYEYNEGMLDNGQCLAQLNNLSTTVTNI